jgi:hypothetical protein
MVILFPFCIKLLASSAASLKDNQTLDKRQITRSDSFMVAVVVVVLSFSEAAEDASSLIQNGNKITINKENIQMHREIRGADKKAKKSGRKNNKKSTRRNAKKSGRKNNKKSTRRNAKKSGRKNNKKSRSKSEKNENKKPKKGDNQIVKKKPMLLCESTLEPKKSKSNRVRPINSSGPRKNPSS